MTRAVSTCALGGLILLISAFWLPSGLGQEKPKTAADNAWTVDDVILAEEVGAMQIAPDGKHAVWVKRVPDKEKNEMIGHLMLSSLNPSPPAPLPQGERPEAVQLTRGQYSSSQPLWSPDGKRIAFLSARPVPKVAKGKRDDDDKDDDKAQVWLINPFGGEPWPLTTSPRDIRTFAWKDNDTILYAAQEKKSKLETDLKEKKDTAQVIDDEPNEPAVRLWKVDVKEKKSERVSDNADRIQSLAVSPDGGWAIGFNKLPFRLGKMNANP
jgi:Tol biopolymer transport system component